MAVSVVVITFTFGVKNGLGKHLFNCFCEVGSISVLCKSGKHLSSCFFALESDCGRCMGNGDRLIGEDSSSVRRSSPMRDLPDLADGMNFDGVAGSSMVAVGGSTFGIG